MVGVYWNNSIRVYNLFCIAGTVPSQDQPPPTEVPSANVARVSEPEEHQQSPAATSDEGVPIQPAQSTGSETKVAVDPSDAQSEDRHEEATAPCEVEEEQLEKGKEEEEDRKGEEEGEGEGEEESKKEEEGEGEEEDKEEGSKKEHEEETRAVKEGGEVEKEDDVEPPETAKDFEPTESERYHQLNSFDSCSQRVPLSLSDSEEKEEEGEKEEGKEEEGEEVSGEDQQQSPEGSQPQEVVSEVFV